MRHTIRFGPYTLDPDRLILRKHDVRVKLQRQPFKVLLLLVRARGAVVTRDTMIRELWGDGTQVDFDRGLNFCVSQIRSALNDDSAEPRYIETVHREGYRFLGEVEQNETVPTEAASPPIPPPSITAALQPSASEPSATAPPHSRRRFSLLAAAGGVTGLGAAGLLLNRFRPKPAPPPAPIPLTGLAGRLAGPSFSPDAKQVAFSWTREDRPAKGEIHVKLIGSAETLQLTNGETLDAFPRWTRDGKSILFSRENGQEAALWEVPALGGAAKRVASLGLAPLFGHRFRRSFDLLPFGGFLASSRMPGRAFAIVRIGERGGTGEAVTSPPKGQWDHNPTVSPDGRWFAFIRSEAEVSKELFVQPVAGGGAPRRLVHDAQRVSSAAWTPDGQWVLFCGAIEGHRGIWTVPAAGGGEPRLLHSASAAVYDVTLSAQADLAAYTEENPRNDLWRAPLGEPGEAHPLITSARIHDSPHFSPDGKRLTFFSNRTNGMQVWVANADGSAAHPLTEGLYPSWSPDGRRLIYQLRNGLYTIPAEGGAPELVVDGEGSYTVRAAWSPDGAWICFESDRGGPIDIWRAPATAGGAARRPVRLTKSGGTHPRLYGGFVYYRKRSVGTVRVPLLEAGEEERMGPEGSAHIPMPGGLYILTPDRELLRVDYRTRAVTVLRRLERASGGSTLAISPDERVIVYAHLADAGHEIMLLRGVAWQ